MDRAAVHPSVQTPRPPITVAAMGPRMLRLAAERTDGTILWLAGPTTIASHVRPALAAARPPAWEEPREVGGADEELTLRRRPPGQDRAAQARAHRGKHIAH